MSIYWPNENIAVCKLPNGQEIKTGSKVSYSVQFLRSIGEAPTGALCHARGTVTGFTSYGSLTLATIDWQDPEIPERVNVNNLAIVGPNSRHCAC